MKEHIEKLLELINLEIMRTEADKTFLQRYYKKDPYTTKLIDNATGIIIGLKRAKEIIKENAPEPDQGDLFDE